MAVQKNKSVSLHKVITLVPLSSLSVSKLICVLFVYTRCAEIVHHFHEMYGESMFSPAKIQLVVPTELKLQTVIQDTNTRLIRVSKTTHWYSIQTVGVQVHHPDGSLAVKNHFNHLLFDHCGTVNVTFVFCASILFINLFQW